MIGMPPGMPMGRGGPMGPPGMRGPPPGMMRGGMCKRFATVSLS
jgi:small nuclear ribonucleoprotein B and B'